MWLIMAVGSNMCYWVINEHVKVLAKIIVQHITQDDAKKDEIWKRLNDFDEKLGLQLNDLNFVLYNVEAGGLYMEVINSY